MLPFVTPLSKLLRKHSNEKYQYVLKPEVAFQTSALILNRMGYSNTLLYAFQMTFQGLASIQFGYANTSLQHSKISLVIYKTKTYIMRTIFNLPILLFLKVLLI
jgi:hypothetical protein